MPDALCVNEGCQPTSLPLCSRRGEDDGVHDERNKIGHFLMNVLLVQLVHQHHNDG